VANLPSNWNTPGSEPVIVKEILHKFLSTGARVSIALVRSEGEYKAMLYIDGRRINGPPVPQPLDAPKGDLTHWMGNKPAIGLTEVEADSVLWEVAEWARRTGVGEK
jgi:hypothetical protein